MLTTIDIVNQALGRLGRKHIADFDDTKDTARNLESIYRQEFESFLCAFPWSFATIRKRLARLDLSAEVLVSAGYPYGYGLPVDWLAVQSVSGIDGVGAASTPSPDVARYDGPDSDVPFDIMRYDASRPAALFTVRPGVRLQYTTSSVAINDIIPDARDALICRIAYVLALTDMNSTALAQMQLERYQMSLSHAIKRDKKRHGYRMPRNLYRRGRHVER